MNRRGMNIASVFAVSVFVILLILAIALLTIERDNFEPLRSTLEQEMAQQRADAALIAFLRQPLVADIDRDGTAEPATVAEAIVAGDIPAVEKHVKSSPAFSKLDISYPGTMYPANTTVVERLPENRFWRTRILVQIPQGRTTLPGSDGNIEVALTYADAHTIELMLAAYDPKTREGTLAELLAELEVRP